MSRKIHNEISGQGTLFGYGSLSSAEVNTTERAQYLLLALSKIASTRSLIGFNIITDPLTDSPHRVKIEERYGIGTPNIRDNANNKLVREMKDAKVAFALGCGHYALISSGLTTTEETTQQSRAMFDEFIESYFGDKEADQRRSKFRKTLKGHLK